MSDLIIVRAEESDLREILELQYLAYLSEAELCGTRDIPPLKQTIEELRAEFEKGVILKVEDRSRIIGSVRMKCENGTVYVGKLMIHPDYRKRGLGTRLLREAERLYPSCRCELFTSTVSAANLRLYESVGYREFKRVPVNERLTFVYLEKHI